MKYYALLFCIFSLIVTFTWGCTKKSADIKELRHNPLDDNELVIDHDYLVIDRGITFDGKGSLRTHVDGPAVIKLFETGDIEADNTKLIYRAMIRTSGVEGSVFLEMWCSFPGLGEYFSRAMNAQISGDSEWTAQETPFFLQKGQDPDNIKLNLVINGKGTVWIDDMHLLSVPLD